MAMINSSTFLNGQYFKMAGSSTAKSVTIVAEASRPAPLIILGGMDDIHHFASGDIMDPELSAIIVAREELLMESAHGFTQ